MQKWCEKRIVEREVSEGGMGGGGNKKMKRDRREWEIMRYGLKMNGFRSRERERESYQNRKGGRELGNDVINSSCNWRLYNVAWCWYNLPVCECVCLCWCRGVWIYSNNYPWPILILHEIDNLMRFLKELLLLRNVAAMALPGSINAKAFSFSYWTSW